MSAPIVGPPQTKPPSQNPTGPGLPEALLWVAGCQVTQLVIVLLLASGLLWTALPEFPPSLQGVVRIVDELGWETSFLFTGAASLAAFLVLAPLVRLRIGREWRAALGLRRMTGAEGLLIAAAVAPLAVLSDEVYRWGLSLNAWCAALVPALGRLAELDTLQLIHRQAATTAYPVLLVAIALAPALTEELVFRGLIGRGLTARWGLIGGVTLTTILFAAAHGTPAHALATLPVGLCLHVLYRLTGTLWAPILLHAFNNALAVTLMKLDSPAGAPADPAVLYAACGYLAVVGALLCGQPRHGLGCDVGDGARNVPVGPAFPMLAASSIVTFTGVFIWWRVTSL